MAVGNLPLPCASRLKSRICSVVNPLPELLRASDRSPNRNRPPCPHNPPSHQLGELGVEAERVRIAGPGNRGCPLDHLPADRLGVGPWQIEHRVDDEDVLDLGMQSSTIESARRPQHARIAKAPHAPLDDRVGAVLAAQRAAALGLHDLRCRGLGVVAWIGQRAIGEGGRLVHVEEVFRGWRVRDERVRPRIGAGCRCSSKPSPCSSASISAGKELLGLARDPVVGS